MSDKFVFHGQTTFINEPKDTVIRNFQNGVSIEDDSVTVKGAPFQGQQFDQILVAFLDAYRTESDLAIMVKVQLNENLNEIAHSANLKDAVFQLINWADANGRLQELVFGAHKYNPGNNQLRSLNDKFVDVIDADSLSASENLGSDKN